LSWSCDRPPAGHLIGLLHAIARDADSTEDTEAGREITGRFW